MVIGMELFGGLVSYYPTMNRAANQTDNTTKANGSMSAIQYSFDLPVGFNGSHQEYAQLCGGHQDLNGTDFADLGYCPMNFNHAGRAFVVLFSLSVGNQWHGRLTKHHR